jgi:transcriptional regulator with XRE-family HTH domain
VADELRESANASGSHKEVTVEETVGTVLQSLREEKALSVERLARLAGKAPSTLYRWEKGESVPRVPELLAVLDALAVPQTQRKRMVALVNSPQAAAHLRADGGAAVSLIEGWGSWMPGTGDLWRAMRLRRGMAGKEVAERLRIQPSAVTRWEKSQTAPPPDRLDELLDLLRAYPGERAYLTDRRLLLVGPPEENATSLDAYEQALHDLHRSVGTVALLPADLLFIVLEAKLWPLAAHRVKALRLLALAYTHHADFLMWQQRHAEMIRYVERAQAILDRLHRPETFQFTLIGLSARHALGTDSRRGARRAVDILSQGAELTAGNSDSIGFYRDLAAYAQHGGWTDTAHGWLDKSQEAAIRYDNMEAIRMGNQFRARLFIQAGRAAEAVPLLPQDDSIPAYIRIYEQLLWAEALLALGDASGAADWLRRFYALVDEHEIEHQRWQGDAIARRL